MADAATVHNLLALRSLTACCHAARSLGHLRSTARLAARFSARWAARWPVLLPMLWALLAWSAPLRAEDLPEYRLKAAFLYNFALFTEWPADVGPVLNLCIVGRDPFGKDIDELQGKSVGERTISIVRKAATELVKSCQVVFIAESAIASMPKLLEELRDRPVLTVADCTAAAGQNVALNMSVVQNKVTFEANLQAARAARLNLSSKLLRLATRVRQ